MTNIGKRAIKSLPPSVKSRLRSAVHPAQIHKFQRVLAPNVTNLGLLTVVIPAFNVQNYLADCLNSVISQSYPYLEIVVVDDGSTDSSLSIAREYARWDKRITVIELEHGGNGRARNVGIASAAGTYLTFADSDDVVDNHAYLTMMSTIKCSGSDFIVGSSNRLIGTKRVSTNLSNKLHGETKLSAQLTVFPQILDDVFLWNKLFRRDFWDQQVGSIPEGVLYEDQEVSARAYVRAENFDVLSVNVYGWRQRPDGRSITQGKSQLKNLQDRLSVACSVTELLLAEGSVEAIQVWFKRLFGSDLLPYFDLVESRGTQYWESLQQGVTALLQRFEAAQVISEETMRSIDPHARVFLMLAEANSREAVEKVIVDRIDYGTGFEVTIENETIIARPSYWDEIEGTGGSLGMTYDAESLVFESTIRLRDFQDGEGLVLRGHAFVRGLISSGDTSSLRLEFLFADGTDRYLPVTPVEDLRIDVEANDAFASHAQSGFEISLLEYPELASAVRAKITLNVGNETWRSQHRLNITEYLSRLESDREAAFPRVVAFASDEQTGSFTIDVDWGSATASEQVYLSTAQHKIEPSEKTDIGVNKRRFVFELHHHLWGRNLTSYPSGAYTFRYQSVDESCVKPFRVAAGLSLLTPLDHALQHANLTAWVTPTRSFAITIAAPLSIVERGKYGQRQLRESFRNSDSWPIEPHAFFESFNGKFCTGNPRSIADELHKTDPNRKIYFSIQDYSVPYPEYAIPLVRGSSEWIRKIQTASHLVNNNNFPFYFRKNSKQFYLQTWHGTPLKKIGLDAPREFMSASYRALMAREANMWDVLISQNAFSTRVFPKAFAYTGQILQFGYPRNDEIVAPETSSTRGETRRILGLSDDQIAVLYAPTWRDNDRGSNGERRLTEYIDFESAGNLLPENFVFLRRGHHNVTRQNSELVGANWIDVSSYPEINDLILASDILVTDYSSIIFDYALLDKPIIIFAPDIEAYGQKIRGLYLDLHELELGPVISDENELFELLNESRSLIVEPGRSVFRDKYVPHREIIATRSYLPYF